MDGAVTERHEQFAFGDFRLDLADERLLGPVGPIKLGNKAFQTLLHLIEAEGRLVTKDSLFTSVWDGTIVSESALASVIKEIRRGLGDQSRAPTYVETVYGRGFRLIPEVKQLSLETSDSRPPDLAEPSPGPPSDCASPSSKRTSICVLPFANMSGEAEQEYFSDGISEDINTDLSKVSALEVIARNTAFMFKGQSVDVMDVARKLNVSHVLEGSVRKAGNRVRITAQLIDGATGGHLWADRFDRDLTDIFAIQDEISKAIVEALRVKLLPEEEKAIEGRGTTSAEAYNLYLMARQQWIAGNFGNVRRDEAIVRFCNEATLLDANYAQAWALMAIAQAELRFWHGKEENALSAAERALKINPKLPEAHCIKARYLEDEGRAEEAEHQVRTAINLDPNSWEVNREAARMLFRHGHIREAIPYFEKAASLMETDWHNPGMLICCYNAIGEKAQLQQAARMTLERAERAIATDPTNALALATGSQALALLGDANRAHEWIRRALLLDPDNVSMRYNLACSLVGELHEPETALEILKPYFERVQTTTHLRHLDADPDLDPIREDPRFKKMFAAAKQRLGMRATD